MRYSERICFCSSLTWIIKQVFHGSIYQPESHCNRWLWKKPSNGLWSHILSTLGSNGEQKYYYYSTHTKAFPFTFMHRSMLYTQKKQYRLKYSKLLKVNISKWINNTKNNCCFGKNSATTSHKTFFPSHWHNFPDTINSTVPQTEISSERLLWMPCLYWQQSSTSESRGIMAKQLLLQEQRISEEALRTRFQWDKRIMGCHLLPVLIRWGGVKSLLKSCSAKLLRRKPACWRSKQLWPSPPLYLTVHPVLQSQTHVLESAAALPQDQLGKEETNYEADVLLILANLLYSA